MEIYLPHIGEARRTVTPSARLKASSRLNLRVCGELIPLGKFSKAGFTVHKRHGLPKKANVEIFEGDREIFTGLIHYANEEGDLQHFEFKRITRFADVPPKDYAEDKNAIAGFLSAR